MRNVSHLLWPSGARLKAQSTSGLAATQSDAEPTHGDHLALAGGTEQDRDDHEVLRKLLADTGHQLHAIDGLKDTFGRLVEPLNNLLTTLEHEKADNARSQGAVEAIRSSHETLLAEFQRLERRSVELDNDNTRLRRDLEVAQRGSRDHDDAKAKLTSEVEALRIAMSVIVKQLGEETGNARVMREERDRLAKHTEGADKRTTDLENDAAQARERLAGVEQEARGLRTALDKALAEASQSKRLLGESDAALAQTRSRLQELESGQAVTEAERNTAISESSRLFRQLTEAQAELAGSGGKIKELQASLSVATTERDRLAALCQTLTEKQVALTDAVGRQHELEGRLAATEAERSSLAAICQDLTTKQAALTDAASRHELEGRLAATEAERDRFAAERDEIEERRQKDSHALRLELHELRARLETTEQHLAEARQGLAARADQTAAAEARTLEVTLARGEAEKKIDELKTALDEKQLLVTKLECEVVNLGDRCKLLAGTLASDEGSLVHARERNKLLAGQLEQLRTDSAAYRAKAEQALVQLNAAIEQQRREQSRSEAALERARADYARLQRAVVEERSVRRNDHQRRIGGNG